MKLVKISLVVLITLASVSPADACFFRHRRARCHSARRQTNYRPVYRVPAALPPAFRSAPIMTLPAAVVATLQAPAAAPVATSSAWVNSPLARVNEVRAQHGLRALAYDPSLAATARANSAFGYGHNQYWRGLEAIAGGTDVNGALSMWLRSPAHRAIILSPTATFAAVETVGSVTTFQAR